MKQLILYTLFMVCYIHGDAQHESHPQHEPHPQHHAMKGNHRVTLGLGHTQIFDGHIDGKQKTLAIASWALNYDYWISDQWAIGLQNDLLLESFIIEKDHEESIERHFPISMIPVGIYKPGKHFSFIAGAGAEFAVSETLFLTRVGLEYSLMLSRGWEAGIAGTLDNNWEYYHSWGLVFSLSKLFGGGER